MQVAVPTETAPGERRVALIPDSVKRLTARGVEVVVEAGAGTAASITDAEYREAGASIGSPWEADVVAKVAPPSVPEIDRLRSDAVVVGFLQPLTAAPIVRALAEHGTTSFAMEAIPRTTRAQS